ncbi:hypothetical protein [Aurantiacibacter luteus]|uniref:Uncharacterized protein n=1 Tax=Aurantiacibacter luteus TaxID=1581420 RepID=A0A0G9MSZ7_9SPHN|nr:hypothetical protein [Aurantiacibacter luteus]KLE33897.1 hypothetical protein AAW00_12585 [Aurantiacibacter luteus]
MSSWAVVAIVAIVMSALVKVFTRDSGERRTGRDEAETAQLRGERDEARAELADLRERVKVLERIATDPARRTADEIEALRDN